MEFLQDSTPAATVVALRGAFTARDHHTFRALLDVLKSATGRARVLDLGGLEFLDSAALGMLLIADDEGRRAGWTLRLRNPPPPIARMLEVAAVDTLLTIED